MLAPRAGVAELVAEASQAPPQTDKHVLLKVKKGLRSLLTAAARSRRISRAVATVAVNWPVRSASTGARHEHSTNRR